MRPIATDGVAWSIDLLVGLSGGKSVTTVSPAKTAERIEMPFGMWTLMFPRNHVLDGLSHPHTRRSNFGGEKGSVLDMSGDRCRYTQSDSPGGSACTVRMPIGCTRLGCTSAEPGEYDSTVRVLWRWGLMSNYVDHLL